MRQTGFNFLKDYKKEFGGSLLLGKRKSRRPLSTKHPVHLVLKSSGSSYFNPGNYKIENLIKSQAKKYGIKIYDMALNWSHIHLLLRLPSREAYLAFIRTITALLVGLINKNRKAQLDDVPADLKNAPTKSVNTPTESENKPTKKIFDLRPYTRIITWGKQFKRVLAYHTQNNLEALGLITRRKVQKTKPKKSPLPQQRKTDGHDGHP